MNFSPIIEKIRSLVARFPQGYKRPAAIAALIIALILLLAAMGTMLVSKSGLEKKAVSGGVNTPSAQFFIPPDELFLPDEPDFVPGVMAERERRTAWTEEDAVSWWRDPLKDGGQNWRDEIEKTVDDILESVP